MKAEELFISAKDGFTLSLSYFPAENTDKKQVIAIHSAVGVRKSFYSPLAKFLAGNGYHVFTLDYRGIGDSGNPYQVEEGMHVWGSLDLAALHEFIFQKFPNSKLHILGHSGGGWLTGFLPPPQNLSSMVFLCVGNGYYNSFPFPQNIKIYVSWKFLIPYTVKKHGVLPTGKSYYGLPLPKNVALGWAEYGLKKDFIEDFSLNPRAKYLENYKVSALSYSFSDDSVLPESTVKSMLAKFAGLKITEKHIRPEEIEEKEIGHFGFLRPGHKKKLWPDLLEWLEKQ
ncbi:alpha/beta hydrolase family protein [Leptospira idonii]|uniref:Alpha/beta fold hydrolase n=1 Tax=Leptospira idonii TaxID=1193500 RepID=A0A4R9LWJ4_9LEPT|nr:alpha/beta fold hydrolase [Leptospira idonii]TGN17583.1 alpha/beta fold hydrolase [Leptospira idonii]